MISSRVLFAELFIKCCYIFCPHNSSFRLILFLSHFATFFLSIIIGHLNYFSSFFLIYYLFTFTRTITLMKKKVKAINTASKVGMPQKAWASDIKSNTIIFSTSTLLFIGGNCQQFILPPVIAMHPRIRYRC